MTSLLDRPITAVSDDGVLVWETEPLAGDVKPATIELQLYIKTRSTEYRKIKQKWHNKLQQQKNGKNYLI